MVTEAVATAIASPIMKQVSAVLIPCHVHSAPKSIEASSRAPLYAVETTASPLPHRCCGRAAPASAESTPSVAA